MFSKVFFLVFLIIFRVNCSADAEKNCTSVKIIKNNKQLKSDFAGSNYKTFATSSSLRCGGRCASQSNCSVAFLDLNETTCSLYQVELIDKVDFLLENTTHETIVYAKERLNRIGPKSRWSFDMDFVDETPDNNGTMFDPVNFRLQTTDDSQKDRFGKANSTLYLNQGYAKVPPGEYMSGDFTMSLWIKIMECNSYQKIFYMRDTDAPAPHYGIFFASCHETNPTPYFVYGSGLQRSTLSLPIKQWSHLVFLMQGNQLRIYIDGQQAYSGSSTPIVAKHHPIVTLGASNPSHSTRGNTVFDDFMIFDRALTMDEITQVSYIN